MFLKQFQSEKKYGELCKLGDKDLLSRIRSFPDQDLLNKERDGNPRRLQVGLAAEEYESKPMTDDMRINLIKAFSSITTAAVKIQETPNMPEHVDGVDIWNYYKGDFEGKKVLFGLTEESPGQIAIYAPTEDLTAAKIGYLDKSFANEYPLHGSTITPGQWHKGRVEICLDMEQLYENAVSKSMLTENGEHIYELPFSIPNIRFEYGAWGDHKADPEILKVFENNMNAFPVKEMMEDMLEKNGLGSPITDIKWDMGTEDSIRNIQIFTEKPLNSQQLLCVYNSLEYLTRESAYEKNQDRHIFKNYMDEDTDFLKAIQNTFKTKMYPSLDDLFHTKSLAEVKIKSDILLTDEDLANLGETDEMNL